jgi:flagellar basal-body rod modification protein FlgD
MNTIDTTTTNHAITTQTGTATSTALTGTPSLGQDDFLRLMVTQIKNQDPTKPMDPTQFLNQLAQFSTVSGISDLNTTMQGVAQGLQTGQVMQAAGLVGHRVLVPGTVGRLSATASLEGAIDLTASTNSVMLKVYDANGAAVQNIDLGVQPAGLVPFNWDGTLANGRQAPAGVYQVEAEYAQDGKRVAAEVLMANQVESVTVGTSGQGPRLEVQDLGEVTLDQVRQVM